MKHEPARTEPALSHLLESDFEEWWRTFTTCFRQSDGSFSPMLQMKLDHSLRVRDKAAELARSSDWSEIEAEAGRVLGLAHDVGRFPQWKRFRTFEDRHSANHGVLGREVLAGSSPWRDLPPLERKFALDIVEHHNDRVVPATLPSGTLRFLGLIRDADKLDALAWFAGALARENPESRPDFCWGRTWAGSVTPAVLRDLGEGRLARYEDVTSIEDFIIVVLSWSHDLSLPASRTDVMRSGVFGRLAGFLPRDPEVDAVVRSTVAGITDPTSD